MKIFWYVMGFLLNITAIITPIGIVGYLGYKRGAFYKRAKNAIEKIESIGNIHDNPELL